LDGNISDFRIPIRWSPVLLNGKPFQWHSCRITRAAKVCVVGPRVYRWRFLDRSGSLSCAYIGQSEHFERRLGDYRVAPKNPGEIAVMRKMAESKAEHGNVELDFLDLGAEAFRINGRLISQASLSDHYVRLLMESLAIVTARAEGVKLLNRVRDNALLKLMTDIVKRYPAEFGPMTPEKKDLLEKQVIRSLGT
jgi:hypothetical protein